MGVKGNSVNSEITVRSTIEKSRVLGIHNALDWKPMSRNCRVFRDRVSQTSGTYNASIECTREDTLRSHAAWPRSIPLLEYVSYQSDPCTVSKGYPGSSSINAENDLLLNGYLCSIPCAIMWVLKIYFSGFSKCPTMSPSKVKFINSYKLCCRHMNSGFPWIFRVESHL